MATFGTTSGSSVDPVEAIAGWELVAPVPFSTVAFRFRKTDAQGGTSDPTGAQGESGGEGDLEGEAQDCVNLAILDRVNKSGEGISFSYAPGREHRDTAFGG